MEDSDKALVARALARDADAVRALVRELTPVIHARVGRIALRRRSLAQGRDIRGFLADVTQDVLLDLFRDDARLLRSWDPERGMGLRGFVGLIAEQRAISILRVRKRNPWSEELGAEAALEGEMAVDDDPEEALLSQELAARLLDHVRCEVSPLGYDLFRRLILDERPIAEVCQDTGMSTSAVQAWSSRLKRLVVRFAKELLSEGPDGTPETES